MLSTENKTSESLVNQVFGGGTPRKALVAALVVGTLLTIINHGEVIIAGNMPEIHKIVLTYCVPYVVATWGAVTGKRSSLNN